MPKDSNSSPEKFVATVDGMNLPFSHNNCIKILQTMTQAFPFGSKSFDFDSFFQIGPVRFKLGVIIWGSMSTVSSEIVSMFSLRISSAAMLMLAFAISLYATFYLDTIPA